MEPLALRLDSLLIVLVFIIAQITGTSAYNHAQSPLYQQTASPGLYRNVSHALYTDLEELARLVDITYCLNPGNPGITRPFNCLSRCDTFTTLELVSTWQNTGLLLTDAAGYIALDHKPGRERIIVAFRGTLSLANVVVDLATFPHEYVPYVPGNGTDDGGDGSKVNGTRCEGCAVHMGFHQSWLDAQDVIIPNVASSKAVHPEYRIEVVGHSLGGAVATLAGLDMQSRGWDPTVTTFGQPRVGNDAFAKWVDESFDLPKAGGRCDDEDSDYKRKFRRVTHVDDPIPLLPLSVWGYNSTAGEVYITKADVPPEQADLRSCRGPVDPVCSADVYEPPAWYNPLSALSAHRNYFWTLGLCVPDYWKGGPHVHD